MTINFILFKVYIEKYTNWSNLKVSKDKYETIIDFGKYRLYLSWHLTKCGWLHFVKTRDNKRKKER